jgi:hypothetical protein
MANEKKQALTASVSSEVRQSGLEGLMRAAAESGQAGARPVETWNPPYCGDICLKICRDGVWM